MGGLEKNKLAKTLLLGIIFLKYFMISIIISDIYNIFNIGNMGII